MIGRFRWIAWSGQRATSGVGGRGWLRGRPVVKLLLQGQILKCSHQIIGQGDRVGWILVNRLPANGWTAGRTDEKVLVGDRDGQVFFAVVCSLQEVVGRVRASINT